MKIHHFKQGSPEWHTLKWGKIGGSSAKEIMVEKIESAAIVDQLIHELTEPYEESDSYVTEAMQRGIDLEPYARLELEQNVGIKFHEVGYIESGHPLLGISPDGVSGDYTCACELKCPGGKTHIKYLRDPQQLLTDYAYQIVNYFASIPSLQSLYVVSYRPESTIQKMLIVRVTRDTEIKTSNAVKCVPAKISDLAGKLIARVIELNAIVQNEINKLKF